MNATGKLVALKSADKELGEGGESGSACPARPSPAKLPPLRQQPQSRLQSRSIRPEETSSFYRCCRSPLRAGLGREGLGPAVLMDRRYCRPCRVPAHPPRWVAPHSTRGKTMDQPTQAVPIPRGHRPANCQFTCIAQRPPSGGAR